MALDVLTAVAAILGLWCGAVWLVEGAAHLAKRLGMASWLRPMTIDASSYWQPGALALPGDACCRHDAYRLAYLAARRRCARVDQSWSVGH